MNDPYFLLYQRAITIGEDLDTYIHNNYDEIYLEKRRDRILQRFEAYLKACETAAAYPDIANDGQCPQISYTDTVFLIMAKCGMFAQGQSYAARLNKLKWRDGYGNATDMWQRALAEVECEAFELTSDLSDSDWHTAALRQISIYLEACHPLMLNHLFDLCIKKKDANAAMSAFEALQTIKESKKISINTESETFQQLAEIANLRKKYDLAIATLQKAYLAIANQCANKTEINRIKSQMRKVLRAQGNKKPDQQVETLLANTAHEHPRMVFSRLFVIAMVLFLTSLTYAFFNLTGAAVTFILTTVIFKHSHLWTHRKQ